MQDIEMFKKKQRMRRLLLFNLCCMVIFVCGCSGAVKQYIRPNTDISTIRRIAVLPLENLTSDTYADEKIKSLVIIDLLSRGIDIVEPGEVMRTLRELNVRSVYTVPTKDIQNIGEMLNVEAVMMGSVEAFEIRKGISVPYPEVSVSLMLLESTSGNIIWSVWHTTGGASFWTRHFGAEDTTLDETSERVVKEAIDTIFGN